MRKVSNVELQHTIRGRSGGRGGTGGSGLEVEDRLEEDVAYSVEDVEDVLEEDGAEDSVEDVEEDLEEDGDRTEGDGSDAEAEASELFMKAELGSPGGVIRPGIVHRLDKGTSGACSLAFGPVDLLLFEGAGGRQPVVRAGDVRSYCCRGLCSLREGGSGALVGTYGATCYRSPGSL